MNSLKKIFQTIFVNEIGCHYVLTAFPVNFLNLCYKLVMQSFTIIIIVRARIIYSLCKIKIKTFLSILTNPCMLL